MDQSKQRDQETVPHCHWHPGVETRLYCSQCGRHICTQCMVQAPVGIRCREHGKAERMPTFEVGPTYYARAIGAGVAVTIGGGLLWALVIAIIPIFSSFGAIGVGYAAGELISRSVNLKRGTGLAWVAGGSVIGAFVVAWLIMGQFFGLFGILFLFVGVYTAVQRVR